MTGGAFTGIALIGMSAAAAAHTDIVSAAALRRNCFMGVALPQICAVSLLKDSAQVAGHRLKSGVLPGSVSVRAQMRMGDGIHHSRRRSDDRAKLRPHEKAPGAN